MESSQASSLMEIEGLTDQISALQADINDKFNQITNIFESTTDQKTKEKVSSILLTFYSKIFSYVNTKIVKSFDLNKLTPFRSNLFSSNELLNKAQENQDEEILTKNFVTEYWNFCDCQRSCFTKISITSSLKIFEEFQTMKKKAKARSLGTLLQNFKIDGNGDKQVFEYNFARVPVCKSFFMHVYSISKKELQRLQACIRNNISFEQNWKGNNNIASTIFDALHSFLKNLIHDWSLPNPNASGPEYFLPSNFNWYEAWKKFVKFIAKQMLLLIIL